MSISSKKAANELARIAPPSLVHLSIILEHLGQDISFRRFAILLACKMDTGPRTNKELADYFGVSAPAMSYSVSELARRGLVKRVIHPHYRREISVKITKKGNELLEKIQGCCI